MDVDIFASSARTMGTSKLPLEYDTRINKGPIIDVEPEINVPAEQVSPSGTVIGVIGGVRPDYFPILEAAPLEDLLEEEPQKESSPPHVKGLHWQYFYLGSRIGALKDIHEGRFCRVSH